MNLKISKHLRYLQIPWIEGRPLVAADFVSVKGIAANKQGIDSRWPPMLQLNSSAAGTQTDRQTDCVQPECTPGNSVSRNGLSNSSEDSQIWEVDCDWSKAHVIHNGLFDRIIMNILVRSVIGAIEGLSPKLHLKSCYYSTYTYTTCDKFIYKETARSSMEL